MDPAYDRLTAAEATVNLVMVVEDQPEAAESLKRLLEQHRYKVRIAKDGGQAQATFVMYKPDFVLLDLILPGESGFEVCERLKQTDETVPVLVLSAIQMNDAQVLARRVGADGYLTKPCDSERLIETIRSTAQMVWERHHLDQKGSAEPERVRFNCECGKRFKVRAAHRGKTLTCPQCGEPVIVPRHD